jgi:hypothetical protein
MLLGCWLVRSGTPSCTEHHWGHPDDVGAHLHSGQMPNEAS